MYKKNRTLQGLFVVALLLIQLFSIGIVKAQDPTSPIVLENDQLRFGTGSENSINATGNLQQPFYKDESGSWRKLTYSSYPLDFEIMEGGDGTDWWNRNGVSTLNPNLQNQTFDYSKYVQTASGGYGTIITSGTLTLNGKSFQVTHKYELPQNKFLIQITTTLTNLSDTTLSNLRYWVGTQDDYIGNNDSNSKTKGNIIDGQFVTITNQSEQSMALKIFNNNEGVLFYTNSDQANTIVGSRYGWSYIQSRNPVDTPINVTGDNSYAFYVRFDDVAPNEEASINWYYAAGTIANLDEIIEDVYDSVQLAGNITNDSIEFEINETRDTTTYYVVLPIDDPVPSQTQIINGQNADGTQADVFGQIETQANQPQTVSVTNLTPETQYKIYIVIQFNEEEIISLDPIEFETTNRYTFTFNTDGGSSIEPITQDVGTTVTPPNSPTKIGYDFAGWDQALPSHMTNQDMTFIAQWEINEYTLTFNSYGSEGVFSNSVVYDSLVQEPEEPTRVGYTFDGWYKEVGLITEWNFVTDRMPANDIALYAKWVLNTDTAYIVEYYQQNINDDDYTLVDTEDLQGTTNSVVVSEAKIYVGFNEHLTHPQRLISGTIEPDGSLVLKRYYDRKEYAISFKDWDDSLIETDSFRYGSTIVFLNDLVHLGYTFDGWYKEVGLVTEWNLDTDTMPADDIALYAKWTPDSDTAYIVEYYQQNINDDDYTLVDTEDLQGTTNSVVVSEAKIYVGFNEHLTHPQRVISGTIEADESLVLKRYYDRKEYTISFKDWDDSLIETDSFRYGSTIVLPDDLARIGYTFNGWDNEVDYVMSDMIIHAKYLSNPTTEVQVSSNTLNANVQGLENAVQFSDEERQEETITKLELYVYDNSVLPDDNAILNEFIRNTLNIAQSRVLVLDISLFKVVGDQQTRITSTNNEITISFVIPSEFRDSDFKLIRVHNGVAELLEYEFNYETLVVTFTTDKFSTYAIISENNDMIVDLSDTKKQNWSWFMVCLGAFLVLLSYKKTQPNS